MRNMHIRGTAEVLQRFEQALSEWAPASSSETILSSTSGSTADAEVRWRTDGTTIRFLVDLKTDGAGRRKASPEETDNDGTVRLAAARYWSPTERRQLINRGVSYWDTTGNAWISSTKPLIKILTDGAQRDPSPSTAKPRGLKSLDGPATARVIVRLLTEGRADALRTLADRSGVGLGTAGRVIDLLRNEGLVDSAGPSSVLVPRPIELARRWAGDYDFFRANRAVKYSSVLGREGVLTALARELPPESYAVTGLRAATDILHSMSIPSPLPAHDLWIYALSIPEAEYIARLVPDRAGDIALGQGPFLGGPQSETLLGTAHAPRALTWRVVGDLLSASGRYAEVGELLASTIPQRTAS